MAETQYTTARMSGSPHIPDSIDPRTINPLISTRLLDTAHNVSRVLQYLQSLDHDIDEAVIQTALEGVTYLLDEVINLQGEVRRSLEAMEAAQKKAGYDTEGARA